MFFLYFYNQCFQRLSNFVKNCFVKYFFLPPPRLRICLCDCIENLTVIMNMDQGVFKFEILYERLFLNWARFFFTYHSLDRKLACFFFFLKKTKHFCIFPAFGPLILGRYENGSLQTLSRIRKTYGKFLWNQKRFQTVNSVKDFDLKHPIAPDATQCIHILWDCSIWFGAWHDDLINCWFDFSFCFVWYLI